MKKCPICQKTFDDDKRFCQIDGTPLIDDAPAEDENPFKTVVVGKQDIPPGFISDDPMKTTVMRADAKDDDFLEIPEVEHFDPMKTMVVSEPIKYDKLVATPPLVEEPEPVVHAPEPPKFNEPNLSPPNFAEFSPVEPPIMEVPKIEPPTMEVRNVEPPKFEPPKVEPPIVNPFNAPPKSDKPISNPFSAPPMESPFAPPKSESPNFDSTPLPNEKLPFEMPKNEPPSPFGMNPPPFKEPEFKAPPSPFTPTPFEPNAPIGQPKQQQAEWNPPPVPAQQQNWQNQSLGVEPQFQSSAQGVAKSNQTLALISLITGAVSLLSLVGSIIPLLGIVCGIVSLGTAFGAIITGFLARGRAKKDPNQYSGGGLALGGIIMGVLTLLVVVAYIVFLILLFGGLIAIGNIR